MNTPPVVLCFGGFDPTNGAGLQADTLTIHALGCHPLSVVTANTIQDSIKVHEFLVTDPAVVRRQAAALLADTAIAACKTGMLASPAVVETVAELVGLLPSAVPLVVDPVLAAGGGASLAENGLVRALREWLLPRATVVTPNIPELLALAGLPDDMDQAARSLLAGGRASVLVTGTHNIATSDVVHRLYRPDGTVTASRWARLAPDFHGSGCTLGAALAAYLARGDTLAVAVDAALDYTWNSLRHAYAVGRGQAFPDRRDGR
jgi:hydroxymethylpyrimidine/phosphomethylpyrimidine kinase